eukprot:gene6544-4718_t
METSSEVTLRSNESNPPLPATTTAVTRFVSHCPIPPPKKK